VETFGDVYLATVCREVVDAWRLLAVINEHAQTFRLGGEKYFVCAFMVIGFDLKIIFCINDETTVERVLIVSVA
jgi:hypothetical protein